MKKHYLCNIEPIKSFAMKKMFIPFALLLLVAVGCNRESNQSNEVEAEPFTYSDSVFLENEYEEGYSHYIINLDLPITNDDTLRHKIIQWMLNDGTEDYQAYFEADKIRFFEEEGNEPNAEFEGNYILAEQTDQYVTYISTGYSFTGGAHPMPWYYGISFSKIDGSILGYGIFEDPEQLIGLVSENIRKQYFEPNNTEEEEYLFEPDEPFQMPTNQPWIESDSMVFCYGPFEIAPYSAGMPLCKIAIEDLKPYLNEKGKKLLNIE